MERKIDLEIKKLEEERRYINNLIDEMIAEKEKAKAELKQSSSKKSPLKSPKKKSTRTKSPRTSILPQIPTLNLGSLEPKSSTLGQKRGAWEQSGYVNYDITSSKKKKK